MNYTGEHTRDVIFSIFRMASLGWISRSRMIVCKPIKAHLKRFSQWTMYNLENGIGLVSWCFSSVTWGNSQLLWAPQWKVWKGREGVRALTPYPLSGLCARTLLWDELWRDGPRSLTCWPVRGRMWRLETGCDEFSSLLSSRLKVYGWINSFMNWVKQGSPSPRTSNSGNQMKQ